MIRLLPALILAAAPAVAQEVTDCDWRASAQAIAEPWADNTRTFSNGKTRLALLDTVEPAAGSQHLLFLSPPYGELGERQCRVVSLSGGIGFLEILFHELAADYDPATGLSFSVPVHLYDPDTGTARAGFSVLRVTLNQATGDMTVGLW